MCEIFGSGGEIYTHWVIIRGPPIAPVVVFPPRGGDASRSKETSAYFVA